MIYKILAKHLIKPETKLRDELGINSLNIADILNDIESHYGIDVPIERLLNVKTVKHLVDLVEELT